MWNVCFLVDSRIVSDWIVSKAQPKIRVKNNDQNVRGAPIFEGQCLRILSEASEEARKLRGPGYACGHDWCLSQRSWLLGKQKQSMLGHGGQRRSVCWCWLHVMPLMAHTWKPSWAGQTLRTERNQGQCSVLCLPCPDGGCFSAIVKSAGLWQVTAGAERPSSPNLALHDFWLFIPTFNWATWLILSFKILLCFLVLFSNYVSFYYFNF